MSYSCNACGFYVQTGQSHSCYTPSDQTTVSQAYIDSLNKEIKQLRTEVESLTKRLEMVTYGDVITHKQGCPCFRCTQTKYG